MAKLMNVKTLDMVNGEITKVEYDGAVYEKVDGKAQIGDLVTTISSWGTIEVGENYIVIDTRSHSGHDYVDVGNNIVGYQEDFVAYRKTSANPTTSLDERVSTLEQRVDSLEGKGGEQAVEYREVKREAKVGELVKIVDAYYADNYNNGDIRKVTASNPETNFEHAHVLIEPDDEFVLTKEYVVLEPINADTITHEGAEYTLVDRKAQPGDVVVFTEATSRYVTNGKPYLVDAYDLIIDDEDDEISVYNNDSEYGRTPANVKVYAPATPKVEPLKVGDYAKIVHSVRGLEGTIVMIISTDVPTHDYEVEHIPKIDDQLYGADAYQLVRATDEEIAEAKAEAERKAEIARWAKIGRKPNEFKKGDIVRVIEDTGANEEGEIVIIAEDGANVYFDECGDKYGCRPHWFELIAPAESRFDDE
ncbi:hypothetical protein [Cytobacillus gottheilii]|uniref:Phage protein n=1 Tax=Cytobacillus gottheilii TaxID=859144 RepID=A0ABX8FFZ6_9BACI|nr:hypothetical protein [Cytobacillus gottheilii]QVY62955.1 hypothetical protein J1899_07900 [Cytobacillus gottheilii]